MRRILCCAALLWTAAQLPAQTGSIERILAGIEQNNKELQAGRQATVAEQLDVRSENNLEDPTVSYARKFGEKDGVGPGIEFEVSQGIDFPTLYFQRRAYGKLQSRALDLQHAVLRRDVLLRAKELCLDLIRLNQLQGLYRQRIRNAEELAALYDQRYREGAVSVLEVNRIKMELMNMRATVAENDAAHRTALQNLLAMNGNMPVEFDETIYPVLPELTTYEVLRDRVYLQDYALRSADAATEAAGKQVTINKQGWLPKFEVGYAREGGSDDMMNGFAVGMSIPIFNNKNKVKSARARQRSAQFAREQTAMQLEADLQSQYNEVRQLKTLLGTYDSALMEQTLGYLRQAVEAGRMSILDYYTEAEAIYQNQEKLLDLENRYQKVMAQIYKNEL